ncbi:MAG: hypothetical protein HY282_04465 [Nitrospirae bacterium]|nr:hypothetical protein [Candidatus Manganitrophaceae bacterium]
MLWSKVVRAKEIEEEGVSTYLLKEVSPSGPGQSPADQIGGKLSAIERDAYERGFASGEKAGREFGLKQIEATHQLLSRLLEELQAAKPALLKNAEKEVLQLALAVARRILLPEISQNPEHLLGSIRTAIQKMGQIETLVIHLAPADLDRMRRERDQITEWAGKIAWLRLEPDVNLHPGECMIESNDQVVDLRIDTQLAVIEEELCKMDPPE